MTEQGQCGHALPPAFAGRLGILDPRIPSVQSTFPGWWDDHYDFTYGMKEYAKFAVTDTQFQPYDGLVQDRAYDEVPFDLDRTAQLQLDYWPAAAPAAEPRGPSCPTPIGPVCGSIVAPGERPAPPGTQSTLKQLLRSQWLDHVVPAGHAPGQQRYANVFQLPKEHWTQRMSHTALTRSF